MNLLLLFEEDRVGGDVFRIGGARAEHVRNVLGAATGDELVVGLHEGPIGRGRVEKTEPELTIACDLREPAPARPLVDVVVAIPRPKSLVRLLREVTTLGADRIVLFRSWRVEKSYLDAPILSAERYRPIVLDGMSQAMTTREPQVTIEPLFKPFVEDRLGPMSEGTLRLLAHPRAVRSTAELSIAPSDRITVVIGPEGGLIPYEIESLERAGFLPISMGARILRVETAAVALLAQLDLLRRRP